MPEITFEEYRKMVVSENFCTEDCPVQMLFDTFSNKWVLRVLFELTQVDSFALWSIKKCNRWSNKYYAILNIKDIGGGWFC